MGDIVCATRGGEGSRVVQEMAIARAKEVGKPLIFLYVADPFSLEKTLELDLQTAVSAELHWMGETLLHIAQTRADSMYLPTEVKIREGRVQEEIIRYLRENETELLMLGAPRGTTANVFGDDTIEVLADMIDQATGVTVEVVRPD